MVEYRLSETTQNALNLLNDQQRIAALHKNGPMVVFAGAGSGKTKTITTRIAILLESNIKPQEILAVTFTNKAAREMKERVEHSSPFGRYVFVATFHSACARWLREFAPKIGFSSDFTIFDQKDSLGVIKTILKDLKLLTKNVSPVDYLQGINKAKTFGWSPENADRKIMEHPDMFPFMGIKIYQRYQEYLKSCNAMDFSDLLMNMLLLLRTDQEVAELLQKRYKHIMVDEFQDTNQTQFSLINFIINHDKNLFVVGDDDQSIYSWRGADPSNILQFKKHFPSAQMIYLEQNYRCTQNIVNAASSLIAKNKDRTAKKLWTNNKSGDLISFQIDFDGETEALSVVDHIKLLETRFKHEQMALFYRTNAQSRIFEDFLRKQHIPYQIYGALRFYDRAEIKDIIAYLRIIYNPNDDLAFKRIINVPPRGIGKKTLDTIEEKSLENRSSMLSEVEKMVKESSQRASQKLASFLQLINDLKNAIAHINLDETVEHILRRTSYLEYLKKKFPEQYDDKVENVHELGSALSDFLKQNPQAEISTWLQDILLADEAKEKKAGVNLMTLHSAKGLEFPCVFIVGVEDGLIPHGNSLDSEEKLEEERRLFYVGITRAKEKLLLFCAKKRRVYNNTTCNPPSRFIQEIPAQLIEKKSIGLKDAFLRSTAPSIQQRTFHPTYGRGNIVRIEKDHDLMKALVNFDDFGQRKVLLSHLES